MASDLRLFIEQFMEEMSSEVGRALIRDVFAARRRPLPINAAHFTHGHLHQHRGATAGAKPPLMSTRWSITWWRRLFITSCSAIES